MMTLAPARAPATAAPRWKSRVAGEAASRAVRPRRRRSIARRRAAVRATTRGPCVWEALAPAAPERGHRAGARPRRPLALRRAAFSRLRARRAIVPPSRPARRNAWGVPTARVGMGSAVHLDQSPGGDGGVSLGGGKRGMPQQLLDRAQVGAGV